MSKIDRLQKLKEKMEADSSLPLKKSDTNLVFGVGDPSTKILFIGEGPGYWENLKKEPFVGNAGKFLDQLLKSIDIARESVYITNVVHHRPPSNRDPMPEEISAYSKYLDEMIEIIDPEVIITLGRFSMGKFLPNSKISTTHGKLFRVDWKGKDLFVIPMYHPAASLRNGEVMRQEKEDFLRLPDALVKITEEKKKKVPKVEQMSLV
jgi:uracil-DNA glycosylase family 4